MKDMSADERPREKMVEKGASALSNAELIAILLRTGTGSSNALEVARSFLTAAGGRLSAAADFSIEEMCRINGIGPWKAVSIAAALELGKRFLNEANSVADSLPVVSSSRVFEIMIPLMKGMQHEECWIIYLNRSNRVVAKERISMGGQCATVVDYRIIVRRTLEKRASSVIMVHNHPSGDPHPGTEDINLTSRLKKAMETFDIRLLDHVIIADDRYYSFADEMMTEQK